MAAVSAIESSWRVSALWLVVFAAALGACAEGARGVGGEDYTRLDEVVTTPEAVVLRAGEVTLTLTRAPVTLALARAGVEVLRSAPADAAEEFAPLAVRVGEEYHALTALDPLSDDPAAPTFSVASAAGTPALTLTVTRQGPAHVRLTLSGAEEASAYGFTFDIASGKHIYGQGQLTDERLTGSRNSQDFPLDAGSYERPRMAVTEGSNVIVPLWLTATGAALFHDAYSFLAVSFNRAGNGWLRVHLLPEWGEREFALDLMAAEHTRAVYEDWVAHSWAARPPLPVSARPPDPVFTRPIWTTWARYKVWIDERRALEFVREIVDHGYDLGTLEIDDRWTPEYGDLWFDPEKFPDPVGMVQTVNDLGGKVTLWVPPFVHESAETFKGAVLAGALLGSLDDTPYPPLVGWWNSGWLLEVAGVFDVSSQAGWDFFGPRLQMLVDDYGIGGFKFDGGEVQFLPERPDLGRTLSGAPRHPNAYADDYARFALAHHAMEVRAGFFAQDVPLAFRQFDKRSTWGHDNGLAAVLTQYLMMGLVGYPFILPDMVGGNEYMPERASSELFVRWVQLNTFLPMIQLSIAPWREAFDPEVNEITHRMLEHRKTLAPLFLELADHAAATQAPLVRPLFWEFPDDPAAYGIGDQFLLGEELLVAPVLSEGATQRRVYLPAGRWRAWDAPAEEHEGPVWLESYPAPLARIPVFERVGES